MTRTVLQALLSHWRQHPAQFLTLVIGLALATALWSGVQAVNAEARASYASAATSLGQTTYSRLTGPMPVAEYVALRRAGWQVSPVIEGEIATPQGPVMLVGIDPLTSPPRPALGPLVDGTVTLDGLLRAPGRLLVAPETLAVLPADLPPGVASAAVPPDTAITDIGTAARLLGTQTLSHIVIAPDQPQGLAPLAILTDREPSVPTAGSDIAQLTESFHLNLTAFGLLAFAVGLFIVQAAIGLAFEQRRAMLRTMRALGVSLPRLILCLALELLVLALAAGGIGILLGYGVAGALLPGVAATLRGLYGANVDGVLTFDPLWAISAIAITMLGTALAAASALWRVARMPILAPAQSRAWATVSTALLRWQTGTSVALLFLSVVFAASGGGLIAGFAALAALLFAAALALPGFLVAALHLISLRARGVLGEWLVADARQQVPALSLALMALLLALAANIGVSTMVGSFRDTFTGWLDQRLASELYVTARNEVEAQEVYRWLETNADAALPIWSVPSQIAGQPAEIYGIRDHATYRDHWPLIDTAPDAWDRLASGDGALINEQLARREGLWPGDNVTLAPGWTVPVLGVYSDYGNPAGEAIVNTDTLAARYPKQPILRYAIRTPDPAALKTRLSDATGLPASQIRDQAQIKTLSLEVFERTFLVTGALNLLTLGVAAFAMLASLLTLSALRLPQVAPVWAAGLPLARLTRFELLRAALLALMTWLLAVPVGLALAWVLLTVVNVEAFGWRLPMTLFPLDWLVLGAAAVLTALAASAWPVWRLRTLPPAALLRVFANER